MHILRVAYENGQVIDFGFRDRADGVAALDTIDNAQGDAPVLVPDDHGHEGRVRTKGIVYTVLTDVVAEQAGQAEVKALLVPAAMPDFLPGDRVYDPSLPEGQRLARPTFSA
jgi:hypothetical protein